jgi:AraC-like DNA-binding protein
MGNAAVVNDLDFELTQVERLLVRTPLVALGEFRCPIDAPQFRGGGPQPCAYVVFPRTPVRISPYRGHAEICTPAVASYYNEGDSYDRHAVSEYGDNSDWIAVSRTLLGELAGFSGCFAPIANDCFLAQQRLFRRANSGQMLSALEVEDAVLHLLQRLLADASNVWKRTATDASLMRPETERRRRLMVDDAKQLIAVRFREELSLSDLARQVHGSPAHLARSFRALTGTSLHEYRTQLRLRAALSLLPDFRSDISSLALDLGFASHSHFGDAFRRQFGLTPSDYAGRPCLN